MQDWLLIIGFLMVATLVLFLVLRQTKHSQQEQGVNNKEISLSWMDDLAGENQGKASSDVPDDPEAAMAWLDQLAERQHQKKK